MPLVKQGRVATDMFVHVADGTELPGDGAVLISAARFLEDPEGLSRRDGKTLFGVLPADRRRPHHRAAPAHAVAPFGECRTVSASAQASLSERAELSRAGVLDRALRAASPGAVIEAALETVGRERLA